jgi:hypothetical protein
MHFEILEDDASCDAADWWRHTAEALDLPLWTLDGPDAASYFRALYTLDTDATQLTLVAKSTCFVQQRPVRGGGHIFAVGMLDEVLTRG